MGHVLRHDGVLHEITEGKMKGNPATEEDYRRYRYMI